MQLLLHGSLRRVCIGVYVVFRYPSRLFLPSLRDRILARAVVERRSIAVGQRLTKLKGAYMPSESRVNFSSEVRLSTHPTILFLAQKEENKLS